jgi:hypothetical protein
MTDTAIKAEDIKASGSISTLGGGVSSEAQASKLAGGPAVNEATATTATVSGSGADSDSLFPLQTSRSSFVIGSLFLVCGAVVWILAAQSEVLQEGRVALPSFLGLIGATVVSAVAVQHWFRTTSFRREEVDPLSLLPLAGLGLLGLSTVCQFFVGDVEPHPEVSAAPLVLAGVYFLLRAAAVRGWLLAGVSDSPLFPASSAHQLVVTAGQQLSLGVGDVVPADCRIHRGSLAVQERCLSPITHFRVKDETEVLFAGSTVVGGSAECVALTTVKDSCLRRLEFAIKDGLHSAEYLYRLSDTALTQLYAYAVLFLSIAAAISWSERLGSPTAVISAAGLVLFSGSLGLVIELVYAAHARLVRQWAGRGYVLFSKESCQVLSNVNEVHFDPSTIDINSLCTVREVELLDDRINREALCGALLSILGRAEDAALGTFGDYCAQVSPHASSERVVDLREYEGWGICGAVKGLEFSIGSEGFLVERGIMVQPSDNIISTRANERTIFVAIDHDVIARCVVSFGQEELAAADGVGSVWADCDGIQPKVASLESRNLPPDALLVRGNDSDALVRSHVPSASWLRKDSLRPPHATLVMLTNSLRGLPELLTECRDGLKWARLCRGLVVSTGVLLVAAVFIGLVTPIVPLVLLPLVTLLVLL